MGLPLSPESRELLKILIDREWHPLDEVKHDLVSRIPPGRALRTHDIKEEHRRRKYGERRKSERSMEEKIVTGRLVLAGAAIHSMNKKHTELRTDAATGMKEIRIRTGVDPFPPKAEPKPKKTDLATALHAKLSPLTEDQVRTIVSDACEQVVAKHLDSLQNGLEQYLEQAFRDIGRTIERVKPRTDTAVVRPVRR